MKLPILLTLLALLSSQAFAEDTIRINCEGINKDGLHAKLSLAGSESLDASLNDVNFQFTVNLAAELPENGKLVLENLPAAGKKQVYVTLEQYPLVLKTGDAHYKLLSLVLNNHYDNNLLLLNLKDAADSLDFKLDCKKE